MSTGFPATIVATPLGALRVWASSASTVCAATVPPAAPYPPADRAGGDPDPGAVPPATTVTIFRIDYTLGLRLRRTDTADVTKIVAEHHGWALEYDAINLRRASDPTRRGTPAAETLVRTMLVPFLAAWAVGRSGAALLAEAGRPPGTAGLTEQ